MDSVERDPKPLPPDDDAQDDREEPVPDPGGPGEPQPGGGWISGPSVGPVL